MSDATVPPPSLLDSAGRVGKRQGRVSELTVIAPLKPSGGRPAAREAHRRPRGPDASHQQAPRHCPRHTLRYLRQSCPAAARHRPRRRLGPLHRRLRPRGPDVIDRLFEELDGLVGHSRPVGQGLHRQLYQLTADSWYCAYPDATVRDVRRGQRIATGINELQKVKPTEVVTDAAAIKPAVLDDVVSQACHHVERYANNRFEADHSRLGHWLRPM